MQEKQETQEKKGNDHSSLESRFEWYREMYYKCLNENNEKEADGYMKMVLAISEKMKK